MRLQDAINQAQKERIEKLEDLLEVVLDLHLTSKLVLPGELRQQIAAAIDREQDQTVRSIAAMLEREEQQDREDAEVDAIQEREDARRAEQPQEDDR